MGVGWTGVPGAPLYVGVVIAHEVPLSWKAG